MNKATFREEKLKEALLQHIDEANHQLILNPEKPYRGTIQNVDPDIIHRLSRKWKTALMINPTGDQLRILWYPLEEDIVSIELISRPVLPAALEALANVN